MLRHVNIGIARGYHHELMVKSRQGQETSTRQGWHTGGVALYGYRFVTHDHPNPHKASRGINKRTWSWTGACTGRARHLRLVPRRRGRAAPDPRCLNADPDHYPPPVPVDPTTALGRWSRSSVWEALRNPKYTGYQVWNRRARKKGHNRTNPPELWVWSEEPAHPEGRKREEYDAVRARAKANDAADREPRPWPDRRPSATTSTAGSSLRDLRAAQWGNHRRNSTYYSCQPSPPALEGHPGRPPAARVPERAAAQ